MTVAEADTPIVLVLEDVVVLNGEGLLSAAASKRRRRIKVLLVLVVLAVTKDVGVWRISCPRNDNDRAI